MRYSTFYWQKNGFLLSFGRWITICKCERLRVVFMRFSKALKPMGLVKKWVHLLPKLLNRSWLQHAFCSYWLCFEIVCCYANYKRFNISRFKVKDFAAVVTFLVVKLRLYFCWNGNEILGIWKAYGLCESCPQVILSGTCVSISLALTRRVARMT